MTGECSRHAVVVVGDEFGDDRLVGDLEEHGADAQAQRCDEEHAEVVHAEYEDSGKHGDGDAEEHVCGEH